MIQLDFRLKGFKDLIEGFIRAVREIGKY